MKGKSVVIFLIIIFAIVAAYFISKQIRIISVNTEEKVIDVASLDIKKEEEILLSIRKISLEKSPEKALPVMTAEHPGGVDRSNYETYFAKWEIKNTSGRDLILFVKPKELGESSELNAGVTYAQGRDTWIFSSGRQQPVFLAKNESVSIGAKFTIPQNTHLNLLVDVRDDNESVREEISVATDVSRIPSQLRNIATMAVMSYDNLGSYQKVAICKNGLINVDSSPVVRANLELILSALGKQDQNTDFVTCVYSDDKFAISMKLPSESVCVDNRVVVNNGTINHSTLNCTNAQNL